MPNGIPPFFQAQREEQIARATERGPGWLAKGISAGMDGAYDFVSRKIGDMAEDMLDTIQGTMATLRVPPEAIDPATYLSDIMKQIQGRQREEGVEDPLTNLMFLAAALFMFLKLPIDIASVLNIKFVGQPLARNIRPTLVDPQTLLTGWLRGMPEASAPENILALHGFPPEQIAILKEVAQFVPGAMDIISFAVREAYDDDYAKRFDMDQGFDKLMETAGKDIKAAGLREPVFRKFWRSHWQLPGIVQAFEMLQRRVIEREDVDQLLIAADVMPWWRDKLVQISFNPLTRVDVRRIHKLLGKDREWLIGRYKDVGYAQDNAEIMADFTIEFNKDRPRTRIVDRELSKADLLRLYKLGILPRIRLDTMLEALGYDNRQIEYFVDRIEAEAEEDRVNDLIKLYRKMYIEGFWDIQFTNQKLTSLGLQGLQVNNLLQKWTLEKQLDAKKPTKSELGRFVKKGVITVDEYKGEMTELGYSEKYIEWYIEDLTGEEAPPETEGE